MGAYKSQWTPLPRKPGRRPEFFSPTSHFKNTQTVMEGTWHNRENEEKTTA